MVKDDIEYDNIRRGHPKTPCYYWYITPYPFLLSYLTSISSMIVVISFSPPQMSKVLRQ